MSYSRKLTAEPQPTQTPAPSKWREARAKIETAAGFRLEKVLFERQLAFGADPARYVTAVCTRRAGKSVAAAVKLLHVARQRPGSTNFYVTKVRANAKRIMWAILKDLSDRFNLGGVAHEQDLCLALPNGSSIYLAGSDTEGEIEKLRGLPIGLVVVDEAQSFPPYLRRLVDEILAPSLMDYAGCLVLIGTPGPVPQGYFHECATSGAWSHHGWSVFDNPWIERKSGQKPQALLEAELQRRGVSESDPVIQREWFGRWVVDPNALVMRWSDACARTPTRPAQHHVIGIDLGFDDSDAIAVLGWRDDSPELDLVHEWVGAKQSISALMSRVADAYQRFAPMAVVADTGGLGKKIAEELQERTGIPIEAADKQRKLEHIELLNDALRTGRFFAPATSRFASDCLLVEWDKSNPEKPEISDRFHSDILDAVLYAWRRCQQWLYVPPPAPRARPGSAEWLAKQRDEDAARMEELWESRLEANRRAAAEAAEDTQWT